VIDFIGTSLSVVAGAATVEMRHRLLEPVEGGRRAGGARRRSSGLRREDSLARSESPAELVTKI
jgi:hypothetical protein